MKILQVNVWTGRMKGALLRFFQEHNFDVICMQEAIWSDEVPDELAFFADTTDQIKEAAGLDYDARSRCLEFKIFGDAIATQGNVILSRYPIMEYEDVMIGPCDNVGISERMSQKVPEYRAQKVRLENGLVVVNHHGYWDKDPLGNEESVIRMRRVADLIRNESAPMVMCGDLNLKSEAPAMRELDFLHDLTAETGTKTTLRNLKFVGDVACDHILVSDNVRWFNFEVHQDILSDHLAISTEIEI